MVNRIHLFEQFKDCVGHKMKERDPWFDLWKNVTSEEGRVKLEFQLYVRKAAFNCVKDILHNYYLQWRFEDFDEILI